MPDAADPGIDQTSIHARRAVAGDADSVAWLVSRLSPALLMQARYRLRGPLARHHEPEDLVQEVWATALPRLPDLIAREGRMAPVFVKFLSTTLLLRVNNLLRSYLHEGRPRTQGATAESGPIDPAARSVDGVSAVLYRGEVQETVLAAIDSLEDVEREVIVLRGIEELPNQQIAESLGVQPSTVTMRYQRALLRLRARLPDSVFEDLPDSTED